MDDYFRAIFCKDASVCDADNYMGATGDYIKLILEKDDKQGFITFLEDVNNSHDIYRFRDLILDHCVDQKAKECTIHFLKAEYLGRPERCFDGFNCYLVEYVVSIWKDPDVFQMFLNCNSDFFTAFDYLGFLPIQIHLLQAMNMDPFTHWCRGDSLIKLIIMLMTDTEMISKSKCLGLLAIYTKDIDKVAIGFYHAGDAKELAALLLFAYDKVFQPLKSAVLKEGSDSDEMVLAVKNVFHGDKYPDVLGLIHLFDKAGDKLSNFSMEKDVPLYDAIIKAARVFKEAGIEITHKDVDLADAYSIELDVISSIHGALGVQVDVGKDKDNGHQFPSIYCFPCSVPGSMEVRDYRRHVPRMYQSYSTAAAGKQGCWCGPSSRARGWSRPSSRARQVAFLAMRLTRGIRFLR